MIGVVGVHRIGGWMVWRNVNQMRCGRRRSRGGHLVRQVDIRWYARRQCQTRCVRRHRCWDNSVSGQHRDINPGRRHFNLRGDGHLDRLRLYNVKGIDFVVEYRIGSIDFGLNFRQKIVLAAQTRRCLFAARRHLLGNIETRKVQSRRWRCLDWPKHSSRRRVVAMVRLVLVLRRRRLTQSVRRRVGGHRVRGFGHETELGHLLFGSENAFDREANVGALVERLDGVQLVQLLLMVLMFVRVRWTIVHGFGRH